MKSFLHTKTKSFSFSVFCFAWPMSSLQITLSKGQQSRSCFCIQHLFWFNFNPENNGVLSVDCHWSWFGLIWFGLVWFFNSSFKSLSQCASRSYSETQGFPHWAKKTQALPGSSWEAEGGRWGCQCWAEFCNEVVSSLILYLPSVSLEVGIFPGLSPAIPEETFFLLFEIYNGQLFHIWCPGELTASTFKLFEPQILEGRVSGMNAVLCTN